MFITPAQLTAHRWHHTKPFWCQHCDMRFAAKGNLVVHLRRYSAKLGRKRYFLSRKSNKLLSAQAHWREAVRVQAEAVRDAVPDARQPEAAHAVPHRRPTLRVRLLQDEVHREEVHDQPQAGGTSRLLEGQISCPTNTKLSLGYVTNLFINLDSNINMHCHFPSHSYGFTCMSTTWNSLTLSNGQLHLDTPLDSTCHYSSERDLSQEETYRRETVRVPGVPQEVRPTGRTL